MVVRYSVAKGNVLPDLMMKTFPVTKLFKIKFTINEPTALSMAILCFLPDSLTDILERSIR